MLISVPPHPDGPRSETCFRRSKSVNHVTWCVYKTLVDCYRVVIAYQRSIILIKQRLSAISSTSKMESLIVLLTTLAKYRLSFSKFCLPHTAATVEELSTKDRYSAKWFDFEFKIPNTLKCNAFRGWQPTYRELLNMDYSRLLSFRSCGLYVTVTYFETSKSLPSVFDKFTADTYNKTFNLMTNDTKIGVKIG